MYLIELQSSNSFHKTDPYDVNTCYLYLQVKLGVILLYAKVKTMAAGEYLLCAKILVKLTQSLSLPLLWSLPKKAKNETQSN